jgi:hypothetical protein
MVFIIISYVRVPSLAAKNTGIGTLAHKARNLVACGEEMAARKEQDETAGAGY